MDAGIRDLIDEINAVDGLVTTSSCAGRVSVFLEGQKRGTAPAGAMAEEGEGQLQLPGHPQADLMDEQEEGGAGEAGVMLPPPPTLAGVGGKGGGGKWLFVSHDPVQMEGKLDSEPNIVRALLGMEDPIFDGREGSEAEGMSDGASRLIHFKFEPMVRDSSSSPHVFIQVIPRHLLCWPLVA